MSKGRWTTDGEGRPVFVPEPRGPRSPLTIALGLVLAVLVVLTVWTFADPSADVPVISPIVCSAKGDAWYTGDAAWGIPAGCYAR